MAKKKTTATSSDEVEPKAKPTPKPTPTPGAKAKAPASGGKPAAAATAASSAKAGLIAPGQQAPAFQATDQHGTMHSLADYTGKLVVLYFYPKDDTPGCTTEACEFRDLMPEFQRLVNNAADIAVIGVSPDHATSHQKFVDKFDLNFTLLADPPTAKGEPPAIANAYGVWQEKNMYGRTSMGIVRTTYVIGPDQSVLHRFDRVKAAGHAERVLTWIRDNANSATA